MRIQNNIPAYNAHRNYNIANNSVASSAEKLSSGYRINRAGDDAAGLAISEKMRAQIRGLEMASKNSLDAVSLIQTAEGALQSTHDILQRMRELAVQAASDTNEEVIDRGALNQEFQALKKELDDISTTTRFNDQNLLDGTFQALKSTVNNPQTTIDNVNALSVAKATAGEYTMTVSSTPAKPSITEQGVATWITDNYLADLAVDAGDKVSSVAFSGNETGDHNGNIYTFFVEASNINKVTFQLLDSNNNIVATAQNVDVEAWETGAANSSANKVNFSGVGTFNFTLSEKITSSDDIDGISGTAVKFVTQDQMGYTHTITMDPTNALNLSTIETAINGVLAEGDLSLSYNPPASTFDYSSDSDTAPQFALSASMDKNGMLTVNVLQDGKAIESFKQLLLGIDGDAAAGTYDIDMGKYGTVSIAGTAGEISALPVLVPEIDLTGLSLVNATTPAAAASGSTAEYEVQLDDGTTGTLTADTTTAGWVAGAPANVTLTIGSDVYDLTVGSISGADGAAWGDALIAAVEGLGIVGGVVTTIPATPAPDGTASTAGVPVAALLDGGKAQVTSPPTRAFLTLAMNGEQVNLYKGDTYANFAQLGISFSFDELSDADIANAAYFGATSVDIFVNAQKGKELIIQSGANQGDTTSLNIDRISSETLGIRYSNLSTQVASENAITEVNNALNQVSTQRAALGALQNRLNFKIQNLDTSAENLTAAESRIRDVDMAKEMTEFSKKNILSQAATAMLAQANTLPQNVLQLLR